MGDEETSGTVEEGYLTLSEYPIEPTPPPINFHAGFFNHTTQTENNYFLLTNLITTHGRRVYVGVTDNGYGYENMRFRNIEPEYGVDTTFTDSISIDLEFPAGEWYLYQVAPVL